MLLRLSDGSGGVLRLMLGRKTGTVLSHLSPTRGREASQSAFRSRRLQEASSCWRVRRLAAWLNHCSGVGRGDFAFLSSPGRAQHRAVFYHLWDEGGWSSSLDSWLGRPETITGLTGELRPRPSQQPPSNACSFPGRRDPRPLKTRPRGRGGPWAGGQKRPGNLPYSRRPGARPCPASEPRQPSCSVGSAPPPTGTCASCSFTGGGKWGPRSQSNRVPSPRRALKGTRSGTAVLQILPRGAQGQKRPWTRSDSMKPRTPGCSHSRGSAERWVVTVPRPDPDPTATPRPGVCGVLLKTHIL